MQLSNILTPNQRKAIGNFLNRDIVLNKNQNPEYQTTISIDPERSVFHFYSKVGQENNEIKHYIKSYTSLLFNNLFFEEFKGAIAEFIANMPADTIRRVAVVLPDSAVLTDTIKIPTLKGFGQTSKTLETTLSGLYRNYKDLHVVSQVLDQNKTFTTFGIVAIKASIISSVYAACLENLLSVSAITFCSNALVSGAAIVNPALKGATYLMLDIKGVYSRFTFVVKGKVAGFYTLPFGREFLRKSKPIQEDMLFDHSYAELMVLTAKEAAKAKKPKEVEEVLDEFDDDDWDENDAVEQEDSQYVEYIPEEEAVSEEAQVAIAEEEADEEIQGMYIDPAMLARKAPRQLPKFMQRPAPQTKDAVAYENFRIMIKWALTLIQANEKIVEAGNPEFVCVNIPRDLMHVIETTNAEADENKIAFVHLPREGRSASVLANLELYAGFFPRHILPFGKF